MDNKKQVYYSLPTQHSPFIQSYTPLVSPVITNVNNLSLHSNFVPLESPALDRDFTAPDDYLLSPPNSFQLNPQYMYDYRTAPITPSQLLSLNDVPPTQPEKDKIKKPSHKEAEQKRRDTLKNSFKICKQVLPHMKDKAPSKVAILHMARDYILDLKHENNQKEDYINKLVEYTKELQALLESNGIQYSTEPNRITTPRPSEPEQD